MSRNSRIQVISDQEDNPELDENRLNNDYRLTSFIKARRRDLGRVKELQTPKV